MKNLTKILLLLILITSCNTDDTINKRKSTIRKSTKKEKQKDGKAVKTNKINNDKKILISRKTNKTNLNFLKKYNGKYPHQTQLFLNIQFSQRIKDLIGEKFKLIKEDCAVELPNRIENETFIVEGCQAHNCYWTNYIIVYDFLNNEMFIGLREDSNVTIYFENIKENKFITEWKNKYNKKI